MLVSDKGYRDTEMLSLHIVHFLTVQKAIREYLEKKKSTKEEL